MKTKNTITKIAIILIALSLIVSAFVFDGILSGILVTALFAGLYKVGKILDGMRPNKYPIIKILK
jgi:hypothetical protein